MKGKGAMFVVFLMVAGVFHAVASPAGTPELPSERSLQAVLPQVAARPESPAAPQPGPAPSDTERAAAAVPSAPADTPEPPVPLPAPGASEGGADARIVVISNATNITL
ncbi:MAG: hypothetical protein FJ149_02965, partial [Euryarchaeota archaeon]|nr:hypothetical protein [Euryarchaeota archaeon]